MFIIMKHSDNSTPYPPREAPAVLLKTKEAYTFWLGIHKTFPRVERLGIGQRIDTTFLSILELIFISSHSPINHKILLLEKTISKLDSLKFFTQLAWENRLIQTIKQAELSQKLEEIGRQLGGWKRGLQEKLKTKTPA